MTYSTYLQGMVAGGGALLDPFPVSLMCFWPAGGIWRKLT